MDDVTFRNMLVKTINDADRFKQGQASAFGLSSVQRMEDIINGKTSIPSTVLGGEAQQVETQNDDPLGIMQ